MTSDKQVLQLVFRVLIAKLGLGLKRVTYDDTAIIGHVRMPVKKIKRSTQFDGPISHNLQHQLPAAFGKVFEIRLPEGTSTFPGLSGPVTLKGRRYYWSLEPLTATLIVRALDDGTVKVKKP